MIKCKAFLAPICLGLGLIGFGPRASAQLDFHVSLNTSGFAGSSVNLDFSLNDGRVGSGGTADGNNTITINNFNLGGGSAGAILTPTTGAASGDIAGGFTLTDTDAGGVADIAQGFTTGSVLAFDVHTTTNTDTGGTLDNFLFRLLDSAGTSFLTTTDPRGVNGFIDLDITSTLTISNVTAATYGNTGNEPPAPTISAPTDVPEPGVPALLIGGSLSGSLLVLRHRRRRFVAVSR